MLERIRKNPIIEKVCAFQRTPWFIACVALVAFLSHVFGLEYAAFWVIALVGVFTLVMQEDTTPFLPCAFLILFSVSVKNGAYDSKPGILTSVPFIANAAVVVAFVLAALIFHIIYYKQYRNFKKRTFLTSGFVALALGFVTNGLFSPEYRFLDLPLGIGFGLLYYGAYILFFHTIKWKKGFSMRYLAFVFFTMGMLISAELGVLYITNEQLRQTFEKNYVWLGWGLSNSIAFVFMLTMPFGFYLTHTEKISLPYFLGTSLMLIAVIFTFSRGSLIVAVPMYVGGTIFVSLFARSRRLLWIADVVVLALSIVVIVCFREKLLNVLNFYIENGFNDRGRFELWEMGFQAFLDAPVFGAGLMFKFGEALRGFYWAHNTPIHFIATGGIVGIGTYLFHRVRTAVVFFKKPSIDRFFAGIAVLCLLVNSLFDIAMSAPHTIMFYCVILAFSEKDFLYKTGRITADGEPAKPPVQKPQPQVKAARAVVLEPMSTMPKPVKSAAVSHLPVKKGEGKARVIFPSVEAGMGHIIPMESVAEMFEKKYGDKTEVVKLGYYRDNATESMRRLEKLFVSTVNMQNKIRGYGALSLHAMNVFGRNSLKYIMQVFVPESYADGLRRMTELDPDLVFSTHWATAYYAARIDSNPLNVQYCPDAVVDVIWNSGADITLMPVNQSEQRLSEKRYQGMTFKKSSFIIRNAAFGIERDKTKLKRELSLWEDCPVITLADGGYGAGRLGRTVKRLLESDRRLNVVAVCGKNVKLHEKLKKIKAKENINFVNLSFTNNMLKYIAAADVFMGKSGASSMAEPRFFGVPIIITMYATPIERDNARYYIEQVGCAVKCHNVRKAVAKAFEILDNPELAERMRDNALQDISGNGAETVADYLFELLTRKFETDADGNVTRIVKNPDIKF
ncbi:MAG: hypothetical protein HFE48_06220 [Clostridia bacterium]|nr:hypothetical protein [Clostridia bacterium]